VTSTRTSITLEWSGPVDYGGCPIYDYDVLRDESNTGAGPWTTVNPTRRNDPTLDQFECTNFPATAVLGNTFVFKIIATNRQGNIASIVSAPMIWAGVPL
jgi:hypothetical protein